MTDQTLSSLPVNGTIYVPFGRSKASVALDLIRGLAALVVFSDHWRYAFFVELHELRAHRAILMLPYLITAGGHQAVIIFFVLSGFLVGGSVLRMLEQHRWSWKLYLTHRFVRLWVVLLPALVLGAFWHHFTAQHALTAPAEEATFLSSYVVPGINSSLNFPDFLGNLAFLQRLPLHFPYHPLIQIPTFGSNGALWSLTNEFWYYLLFPLGLLVIRKENSPSRRVAYAIAFVAVSWMVGSSILLFFLVWLGGILPILLPKLTLNRGMRRAATAAYLCVFLFCVGITHQHQTPSDFLLAFFTVGYLWILLSASREAAPDNVSTKLARNLARFSYTLYLVHMPMLYFFVGFTVHGAGWVPGPHTLLIASTVGFVILGYAWIFAALIEFRNEQVRRWVEARLGLSAA